MRKILALISLFAAMVSSSVAATAPATVPASSHTQPQSMPRYFEQNRGQWPAAQAFRAYGYGFGVSLAKNGVTLQVANPKDLKPLGKNGQKTLPGAAVNAAPPREVSLRFEGASSAAHLTGIDELTAKGAWFQGAEANWHSDIPLFERVRAEQVYPGVSATFYGRDGQLEYDLDVAPGAKAGAMIFDLDGADHATIEKNGDLNIEVNGQKLVLHKPLAWQPDGESRKLIEVSYALLPANGRNGKRIGLGLKDYDASKPLTIDPVLTFATYLSSASSALPDYYIVDLAIDSSNNVYVLSTDSSNSSMTVQKLTSVGALVYTATFSTPGNDTVLSPTSLRVNASGQAYVSADARAGYPTTSTAYKANYPNASYSGNTNGAFSVISQSGASLVYSTYFGGVGNGGYGADYATAIAIDGSGNAYLTGQAGGGNFPTTAGAYQTTYSGGYPAGFVAKFNPSASGAASLVYSTLLGGSGSIVNGIGVDGAGDAYLAATNTSCTYLPTTAGAFEYSGIQSTSYCGYVTAVNPIGTALNYSAYIGPGQPLGIAVDGSQNAYVVGDNIQAEDFPTTTGAYQTSYPDGFAMELNPTGALTYSTFLSGPSGGFRSNLVSPSSIALAPGCTSACDAYIAAVTSATDFPVINGVGGAPPSIPGNELEPVFVVLNGAGSAALTSGYLSGLSSYEYYYSTYPYASVAVDTSGNAWLTGSLSDGVTTDFPVTTTAAPGPNGAWLAEVSMTNAGNVIAVPNSVNFGTSIPVNVSSTLYDTANSLTPTTVVLRNMGSVPVTLASIVASPAYFTESDNCNGQIAASSYCTVTLVFTPPSDAPVTGTLTVASNGLNSPQVVPLSGQGADGSYVQSSTSILNFGNVTVNTTSAPLAVTLTNIGNEPAVNLNTVYFNGYLETLDGFTGETNCPASLPPGDSCQAQVTFSPNETQVGPQSAILDDYYYYYSYGLGDVVTVTGTGVLPTSAGGTQSVALSATTLNFGTEGVGESSGYQYVYLTNTGSQPLVLLAPTVTITSGQGSAADFQVSIPYVNLAPQVETSSNVIFTPSVAATETATLSFPIAGSSTVITVSMVGQGMANTQTLEFQPGNAIFPDQPVATSSAAQYFYVFNTGNTPFVVDRVLGSGDFSILSTSCTGTALPGVSAPGVAPTAPCSIGVVFTPSQSGARAGSLTVIDAASATPQTIPLAGNGITAVGVLTVTPSQPDFGSVIKGTSGAAQSITLANSGNVNLTINSWATTGDYALTNYDCATPPFTISPGQSCFVNVTFTPTVTTSPDNGTLTINSTAGNQVITLTGGGEAGALASGLSPTSANFGSYEVGTTTNWIPVYVRNSGTETLTFTTVAKATGDFTVAGDYCNTGGSGQLQPGQDCYLQVEFGPTASGSRTGTLTVKSNAGTLTASLSGTGTAVSGGVPNYFNPPAMSFDQQAVNSISPVMEAYFAYTGIDTHPTFAFTGASITAGSANFALASGVNALNNCMSAPDTSDNCQVNLVFSPTAAGYATGTLTITTSVGNFAVALSGYAPPSADTGYLSPGALEFPSTVAGTNSAAETDGYQVITLYNTGAASFTVGSVGGTNFGASSDFQIYSTTDYCSSYTLAPVNSSTGSTSCYIYVQFSPTAAGTRTGTVTFPVTYSDGTTGTFTANLTGIGVGPYNEAVLNPTVAGFPDTAVGTVGTNFYQYIYLTNSGNLAFNVGQLTSNNVVIGATGTGDFSAASPYGADYCSNTSVAAAGNCYILAYFKPASAGAKTGTVTFPVTYANSSTPVMITATLTGNGIAANPAITINPAGIQFDTVTAHGGSAGNAQTVTVTNTGNVPIMFTSVAVSTGFTLSSDGCTTNTVLPGGVCSDYVYFNPASAATFSGSLTLTDNATGSPQSIALSGTSLAATSELEFSQTTVSFGNQLLNNASNQLTFYLINRGSNAVTVSSIALAGANPGDYQESDSCAGYSLAANANCLIYLTFTPSATGSRTANLKETDSGTGGPRSVSISGTGINASTAITFFPAALTFSSTQTAGEGSPQQLFSVTNIGVNPVTISAVSSTNAAAFPISQNGCTGSVLSTGQSCLIVVLFTPSSAAADTGFIKVTDNASGSPQELPVSGTGIAQLTSAVTLTATPTSAAYGSLFTLSAAVKDQNSNPVSNGRVTFYDGTAALGTAQVATTTSAGSVIGSATLKTILVPLGSNNITATYVGGDATSTSTPVAVTVTGKYPTTTTFTSSGVAGDYTFTGTVLGMGPVVPTGSVTFTDNTTGLVPGTANINAGSLAQTFVAAPTITGINPPDVVAFADLNGDGIPDLVTGTETNGLLIQLGNGDGTFQAPYSVSAGGVSAQNEFGILTGNNVVFGDFNGDGNTDIAFVECANGSSNCAVGVLLGNGDGTFQKERYNDQSSIIGGVAAGDFNGDGILDLAVANYNGGTVDVLFGNGDGTFQQPIPISMPGADSVAAGDLIGNGKLDLVVTNWGYSTVSVLLGNGNGTFQPAASYSTPVSGYPNNATLSSLRSNGRLDIVLQDYYYGSSVLLVNSNGTFGAASPVYTAVSPSYDESMAVADINGDGKPDLITVDSGTGNVDVLLGTGTGTFGNPIPYPTGITPIGVAIADINHDGRLDIAVANQSGPSDSVLLNHVTQTAVLTPTLAPGSGTHSVSGAYSGDTNFATSTSNTLQLAASLITPTMMLGASPSSTSTPWGQQLTLNVTVAGAYSWVPAPTGTVSYSIDSGAAQPATLSGGTVAIPISQLSVGSHSIAVSYGGDQYYATLAAQTLPITIIKANQAITFNALPAVTYGVAPITLSATSNSGLAVTFTVTSGPGSITNGVLTVTGAGTIVIAANQAGNVDYNAAPTVTQSLSVAQQPLTVTVNSASMVYGATLPTFSGTINGVVNGDTITAAYSSTGTASSPAGTYPITAMLSGSALPNYAPTIAPGTLTITKAVLTVTAINASRFYNTANPTFTDSITGFVNGDTQSVVTGAASLTTTATISSTVGTYTITAAKGTLAASNYTFTFVNGTLTVNQATPTITWTAPPAITYGTPLSAAQLNASSTVAGNLVYTPALGATLGAGTQTLSVTLNPTDTTDYTTASKTVSLTVNQATPTITWNTPAAITYGTPLSGTQLDASSPVSGNLTYTPTLGATLGAGTQMLSVTLTPSDTTDYTSATKTVSLTVSQATPTITWATPAAITYGTPLSATQLSATSTVSGNLAFTPVLGTVLSAGTQTLSVTLTPSDTTDYTTVTKTVSLTVNPATLTVTANNASRIYETASPTFTDTISGFVNGDSQSVVTGAATLSTTATYSSTVGSYPITPAKGTLSAANYTFTFVNGTLAITQATPTITWATPAAITYGTALGATQLDASSAVAGNFAYTPASGTVLATGTQTLSVTLTPTDAIDYTTATRTVSLTVNKAALTVTANNLSRPYETANPTLTDSITGFVNGDPQSVVSGAATLTTTATLSSVVGSYTITAAKGTLAASNYTFTLVNGTLTVSQATPTISWTTPAAITYGTALSSTQLNASSTVAGMLVYTPALGTTLGAGNHTLSVTLTPTDTTDYTTATQTVSLTVNQATPTITWPTPAAITYGTALSATQLNASSTVSGNLVYTPTLGATLGAGTQTLSVTLTPSDATDYTTATKNVSLVVNQATPTITWATPAAITYPAALSGTQLNASSTVAGMLVYTPVLGTVLSGGTQTLSVTLSPTDATDYTMATTTVMLMVNQATQTITFAPLSATTYGAAPFAVSATASSGLAVTFSSTTTTICTVSANTVTMIAAGTCSIEADQAGNADYSAAAAVTRSFAIHKATQTITFPTIPTTELSAGTVDLSATATSGLPISYASTTTRICAVSGSTATLLAAGSCSLTANQAGNGNYLAATQVEQTFTVNVSSQTITFATPPATTYGAGPVTLSATASSGLPVSFTSTTTTICTVSGSTVTLVTAGTCSIEASQAGNADFLAAPNVTRSFAIHKATQTITFPTVPATQLMAGSVSLSATASSGLAVVYESTTPRICSVSGSTATLLAAGTCGLAVNQAGNGNYLAATQVEQSFAVNLTAQTITFAALPAVTYGAAPFTVSATASSGLTVTFTSATPLICTVSGTTVTIVSGNANCTIKASQAGNTDYSAAVAVSQSFRVNRATQAITFTAISAQTVGTPLTLTATASSGLAITYTSTTTSICTVSGSTATFIAAGTCSIQAAQAGNSDYLAATTVTRNIKVNAN